MEMFTARDKALAVAVEAMSKRLDAMNEFRASLTDQSVTFARRAEIDIQLTQLNRDIDLQRVEIAKLATQSEVSDKASTIARSSLDKRLEGMNEFRQTINDAASHYITRSEIDIGKTSDDLRFRSLERMVYIGLGGVLLLSIIANLLTYFRG